MRDREKFNETLIAMAEIFDKQLSESQLDLYWNALNDLSDEDFNKAANIVTRTCEYFPRPVNFREHIIPDIQARASIAYDVLEGAFKNHGIYASVNFADKVITAVVKSLGGWVKYCEMPDDELKWYRKDFERKYTQYYTLRDKLEIPDHLVGLKEANNAGRTDYISTPVLVGGEQKKLEA